MFNLMLESVLRLEDAGSGDLGHLKIFTLSPGARGGWNIGDRQVIIGAALPVTWIEGESETALLLYFSYELPFKK
jgi:hypothetical protein